MADRFRYVVIFGILFLSTSGLVLPQTPASMPGLPGTLKWQNTPASWKFDNQGVLAISANAKTDWFVDPFDGTVANNAPILLFIPDADYVFTARVTVKFVNKSTLVTVVTRGSSDDCNSKELRGDSVYLRIAKSGKTYVFYSSTDGRNWQIVRTFSLDTELLIRVGFEAQSPAGSGAVAKFAAISYDRHRIHNTYK